MTIENCINNDKFNIATQCEEYPLHNTVNTCMTHRAVRLPRRKFCSVQVDLCHIKKKLLGKSQITSQKNS